MSLEERMKEAYKNLKSQEGKFAVVVWDPSNPEKSIPTIVAGPYTVEGFAIGYARRMNKKWYDETKEKRAKGLPVVGEADYFVVDGYGDRIC